MSKLVVKNLCKQFRSEAETLDVLNGVELELNAGDNISIVGPSGCGKSTLLYILGTLDQPTSGDVMLDGVNPFGLTAEQLALFRNRSIGFIFQDHHLLPQLSVLENVMLPALAQGSISDEMAQRAEKLIADVGLSNRGTHLPGQLSGGERQRVAVARSLLNRPKLLLADEPTGNLDLENTQKISELLFELPRREQAMLIVVTHSDWLASRAAKQMELRDQRLVAR